MMDIFFKNFFPFIENRLLSHTIYPDDSFLSLYSSLFFLIFPPTWVYSFSVTRKLAGFWRIIIKYNKIKQKLTYCNWTTQANRRKRAQDKAQKQRLTLWYTRESYENTKLEAIIYTQKTWCRPMHAALVSVSSYELWSCWFRGACFLGVLGICMLFS